MERIRLKHKRKITSLISPKKIEKEVINDTQIIIVVAREVAKESQETIPPALTSIITKFVDVFPKDLPDQLPLMRDIQHAIDLVSRATLPNLATLSDEPDDHAELQKQVDELLSKEFI